MTANPLFEDIDLPPQTEEEVYQSLVRALRRKSGFGLFFVQCSPSQEEGLIAKLKADLPQKTMQVLQLDRMTTTVYDKVQKLWNQQPIDILFIRGLELSLPVYEDTKRLAGWSQEEIYSYSWKGVPPIFNHLNQQRERFRDNFQCCFVLFVRPFIVKYFIQRAPDFFDWRSGLFEFPADPQFSEATLQRITSESDYDKFLSLSSEEQVDRLLEIESLLSTESQTDQAWLLVEKGNLLYTSKDYQGAINSYNKAIRIDPNDNSSWINKGLSLSYLGRHEEAFIAFDRALKINLDSPKTWYSRSLSLYHLGRGEEAKTSANIGLQVEILHKHPMDATAWYKRALGLAEIRWYEEAVASYDKAVEIQWDSEVIWLDRGVALHYLNRYEEAIASYEHAIVIKPDYAIAWNNQGTALERLGRYEESISALDHAIQLDPDYSSPWNNRGWSLYNLQRYWEAINALDQALKIDPDFSTAQSNRKQVLAKLSRDEKVQYYTQVTKEHPDNHEAWSQLGFLWMNLKQYKESSEAYRQVVKLQSTDNIAWRNLGYVLVKQEQYEEAIECYEQALKFLPNEHTSLHYLGNALFDLSQYKEALPIYTQAVETDSTCLEARNQRGRTYLSLGQYEEALADFNEALKLSQQDYILYNQGFAYEKLKQYEIALESYNNSIAVNSEYQSAWFRKGLILGELNRYEEAIQALNEAIRLDEEDSFAWRSRALLMFKLNRYKEAISDGERALELFRKFNSRQEEANTLICLVEPYRRSGKIWKKYVAANQAIKIFQEIDSPLESLPYPNLFKQLLVFSKKGELQDLVVTIIFILFIIFFLPIDLVITLYWYLRYKIQQIAQPMPLEIDTKES